MDPHAPRFLAVGTALPHHVITQEEAREIAALLFSKGIRDIDRLIRAFGNGLVETRHISVPLDWFREEHNWETRTALYETQALELGEHAAKQAIERAGIDPLEIKSIVFISTTGLATPSLDGKLIKRLGLSRHTKRLPIWGLGCAGGAAGINRAAELSLAQGTAIVLLVAVELCSLTFQRNDLSKSNLIASSLFADGAAALILGPGLGPRWLGGSSTIWDDTEDVMGWEVISSGLRVRFSKSIPDLVREFIHNDLSQSASTHGLRREDLAHFVMHPGGLKVLQAFAETLGLPTDALADALEVLKRCGNMSSASVLFVLEKFLGRWKDLEPGQAGVISAMGPGFSAEHAFFLT